MVIPKINMDTLDILQNQKDRMNKFDNDRQNTQVQVQKKNQNISKQSRYDPNTEGFSPVQASLDI